MQTHRLRRAEIVWLTQDGDANARTVHIAGLLFPANHTPLGDPGLSPGC